MMQSLSPCPLDMEVEEKVLKMELGPITPSPSPSTLELCAPSSPPHLVPEVPLELYKRERRDSSNSGDVEERGMPDTPISPQSCSPLPFPKILPSPLTPPTTLLPGDREDSGRYSDEVLSLSSSSPLSSIPSPTGSVASLFGAPQDSSGQQQAHSLYGSSNSSICTNNQGSSSNTDGWSTPCSIQSSSSSSSSSASSTAASSAPASPAEEADMLCQWEACRSMVNPADLLEHLRIEHVDTQKDQEKFVCQWGGCKVAGKASCSMSWLERHVVTHGGLKPFRCILPHCGARFPTQLALQRHVNGHFPAEASSGSSRPSRPRGEDSSGRHIRRRNKVKRRRPQCVKHSDFFDAGIMDRLRQQLVDLTEKTHIYVNGSSRHLTFQGTVKGHRCDQNGKESLLLQWSPRDILEETWLSPSQVKSFRQRTLPLTHIPASTVAAVHPSFYSPHRFRKHRRK